MGDSNDQAGSKEDGGTLSDLIAKLWRQGLSKVKGNGSGGTGEANRGKSSETLAHYLQELCDGHSSRIPRHSNNILPPQPPR